MSSLKQGQFSIHNMFKGNADIIKTYNWELEIAGEESINQNNSNSGAVSATPTMKFRMRTAQLPGISTQPIESYFMGTKRYYPGRTDYTGTLSTTIEDLSDLESHRYLMNWMNQINGLSAKWETHGQRPGTLSSLLKTAKLRQYRDDGALINEIEIKNIWPQQISEVSLDYQDNNSVKYDVTWQYDAWLPLTTGVGATDPNA